MMKGLMKLKIIKFKCIRVKKKILHAIRQGEIGGGETHVLDLVNHLDKAKYESVILSFTDGPMVDQLKASNYKTYVIKTTTPFDLRVWSKVKKIISTEKIDLIHAHGTRANSNTFYSAKALKIPLIYTVHGWSFHPDQNKVIKLIRTLSERFLVRVSNKTICVSESNLTEGKRNFPMSNAVVIVNGINKDKFDPDKIYPDIRKEFEIGLDEVVVGYIARITHQKSPLTFLRSIADVPSRAKYLIVGNGDLKPQMLQLAEELNLKNKLIFLDFRKDIPAILNSIDIFCLPSLWEGLPIALLEAMAMRKAIIASEIDGITDLIINNENGLIIPPLDIKKLALALELLITDKSFRNKLGKQAELTVKKNYNITTMTRKIQDLYTTLT
ncbi:glycosyltransferase [Pedobacter aquatilis]|uniref:glycosyltransferase n=1 Tax=Pedobacter aquatilis TaxID=351343 RepID=UPI002931E0BF|nr:glycosyltransferase [Pedobacter aquatilis]